MQGHKAHIRIHIFSQQHSANESALEAAEQAGAAARLARGQCAYAGFVRSARPDVGQVQPIRNISCRVIRLIFVFISLVNNILRTKARWRSYTVGFVRSARPDVGQVQPIHENASNRLKPCTTSSALSFGPVRALFHIMMLSSSLLLYQQTLHVAILPALT
jgi:hypothetical protein